MEAGRLFRRRMGCGDDRVDGGDGDIGRVSMPKVKDLMGQRFGRLVCLSFSGMNKHHNALWLCRCDCGF